MFARAAAFAGKSVHSPRLSRLNPRSRGSRQGKKRQVNDVTCGISLVGVGGQGTILVARILAAGLVELNFDVKISELHGMAQLGGSVITQLRYGEHICSPIMAAGESDFLVAFEILEAARNLHLLKKDGVLIVNDALIPTLSMNRNNQARDYATEIKAAIRKNITHTRIIRGSAIADRLGNIQAQNMVLLGALIRELTLSELDWQRIMKSFIPAPSWTINAQALATGLFCDEEYIPV